MERMLRLPEVVRRTGLSAMTLWRRERAGTFPARCRLGPNSVAWPESEVDGWIEARKSARNSKPGPAEAAEGEVSP